MYSLNTLTHFSGIQMIVEELLIPLDSPPHPPYIHLNSGKVGFHPQTSTGFRNGPRARFFMPKGKHVRPDRQICH